MRLKAKLLFWPLLIVCTFLAVEMLTRVALRISFSRPVAASEFLLGSFVKTEDSYGCTWGDSITPHPYLGYAYHRGSSCSSTEVNSYGFKGPEIPSLSERKEGYFVLLLGGSVAELILSAPKNSSELELFMNSAYISPNGKPFRFINGAIAGARHPVQSVAILYFAESVDAVISIEGFNDIIGVDKRDEFLNPPYVWYEFNTTQNRALFHSLGLAAMTVFQRWLNLGNIRKNFVSLAYFSAKARAAFAYGIVKEFSFFPRDKLSTTEQLEEKLVSAYRTQLRLMAGMAKAQKLPFAVFFQPVPALHKKLTTEEISVVGAIDYGPFYQNAVNKLISLRAEGVNTFSLLETFRDVSHTIYIDHIHFFKDSGNENPSGYELVAQQIGNNLAEAWGLKKRKQISAQQNSR